MIVINAKNQMLGRIASEISKKLLRTKQEIIVVNSKDVFISGDRRNIINSYLKEAEKNAKGNPRKTPIFYRYPNRILKKSVRGMLPRNNRGSQALKRLKVYIEVPEKYSKDLEKEVEEKNIQKISLLELSRNLGAKI